ncbi:MAG: sulfatase-like hydrolase/transferase [Bacillota bacterium]|nr:sulfatase-like hydrolase/transferase [Bacillota bacterium]
MGTIKNICKRAAKHRVLILFIAAIVLNLIIETLGRHSLIQSIAFMVQHPLVFFCNTMLILAVISLALLFRRWKFAACMLSIIWLALGITNGVILANRMTPFNVKDMSNLSEGLSILTNYFTTKTLIIIGLAIAALVLLIIFLFRKLKPMDGKVNYKRSVATILIIVIVAFGSVTGGMRTGVLDTFFGNLAYAYRDNGVPYSFLVTWVKTGIDKPKDYSEETIKGLFDKGELGKDGIYTPGEDDDKDVANKPNIIFLQLESFIDPQIVTDIKYNKDPMPNYRKLMKEYTSGYITVPAVGAGTANVEFEAMTGISARFFGPGEYPHKSVLTEKTCESIPFDLRQLGYTSHAIHNHRGAFYNRNKVFKNLGFDTFTCLEYMNNVVKTPKNWAKDALLTECIVDAMDSTKGPDYIYTISVQGHGKYPTEKVLENPEITVTEAPNEEKKWAYEYYANQVYEMDIFVKELTDTLANYDEDVVLVMYGDHLPALDMTEEELKTKNLYQTEYIVWSNFGLKMKNKDTYTYEIPAQLLKKLGMSPGMLTKYHQNHKNDKHYKENLEALSYDMLYGKNYIFGGKSPFEPTEMKMGVKDIEIEEIVQIGDKFYIKGKNFTEFSKISLDGKVLKTVYLGPNILALNEEVNPEDASRMKVSQVEKNKEILSTTE